MVEHVNEVARQAVLVLGMHRSGTSVITQALSYLGAQLPAEMLPPALGNEGGFFEPRDIVEIHERALISAGTAWRDWSSFPRNWYRSSEAQRFTRELIAAFKRNYGDAPFVVLKDPRICRFVPLWTSILAELQADPIIVLVARSLRDRDGISAGYAHLLWLRHLLDSEFSTRGLRRAFLNYRDFLEDCRGEIRRLVQQLPVAWPRQSAEVYNQIEISIRAELRHRRASSDPHDTEALHTLDRVRLDFDAACEAFAPAFQGDRLAKEEVIERLNRTVQEIEGDRRAKDDVIERLNRNLQEVEGDRRAKDDVIERLNRTLQEVEGDRRAKDDVIERLNRNLQEVEGDRRAKDDVIERLNRILQEVDRERRAKTMLSSG